MVSNISEETKPAIIPIIAPVGVKRFQYIVNNNTGKLLAAATMKVSDTRKVTLIFSSRRANKVEIIPIESAVQRAAHNCSFSVDIRSEEHTSELQSRGHLVCRLLLE